MALQLRKPAGTWTFDDLLSLPDDGRRYEIIDGELYEMPSPAAAHAVTIKNLMLLLGPIIEAIGGWLMTAPLDVFFFGADPVQPDLVILLPQSAARLTRRGVVGPPELVIEVLSPSNRGHDLLTKRALYARAGVREYWIVDPERRSVEVMTLVRDAFHAVEHAGSPDELVSPTLDGATFATGQIFARLDEIDDEPTAE